MLKGPLPQFKSLQDSVAYYAKFGKLEYYGREGPVFDFCLYRYTVRDGRVLRLKMYDNGKVDLFVIGKR